MKLLIITCNGLFPHGLKAALAKYSIIDVISTFDDALFYAKKLEYQAIIVYETYATECVNVCMALREHQVMTPLLVLAPAEVSIHKASLLNSGADNILEYPCSREELSAYVKALSRREKKLHRPNILKVADLQIDLDCLQVHRADTLITLRRKELEILTYLVRNKGRAVSRAMIVSHVWEIDRENWHNTVDVHIKYLRDKIDRPFTEPLIKTVYGIGYTISDT